MNKRTMRIAGWALGLSMAVAGIGVTAGASQGAAMETRATDVTYELYSGALTEGDYLIVYDGAAMNTTVSSDRLQYTEVTVTNDTITNPDDDVVWHIAPSGNYWTIYNAGADAYAASTGAKNKAQMLASGTDNKSQWTVSGTETYEFVNKANSASSVNANLRKNGTYGFACYSTGTGGALSLYKQSQAEPVTEVDTTIITLGATYGQGESAEDFYEGSSFNLAATLSEGSTSKVAWTVDNTSTASATITPSADTKSATIASSSSGTLKINAQAVKSDGTTPIDGKSASYTVTVKANTPTSVAIGEKSPSLKLGGSVTLSATVNSEHGNPSQAITWSSSNAEVATIDSDGKITPVAVGKTTIKATATGHASVYDSYELTIYNPIYKMVTSASDLTDGDTVVIGALSGDDWYLMGVPSTSTPSDSKKNYWTNVDHPTVMNLMFNESVLTNGAMWTYGLADGKASFKDTASDKYLGAAYVSSNSKYCAGEYSANSSNPAKWNLTFGENGVVTIINDSSVTFDFIMYGGNTPEFQAYSSSSHTTSNLRLFKCADAGIAATSATTSINSGSVRTGKDIDFTYSVSPSFNTDTVTVSSSDTGVATVSVSGNTVTVHGVATGTANVLLKNSANETIKSVPITVNAATVYDHITVDASNMTQKTYTIGDAINTAGVKAYAYTTEDDSGNPVDVTLETEFSANPTTANAVSNALAITITGTYENGDSNNINDTDTVNVVVNPVYATGVTLTYAKASYEVGTTATPTVLKVNNDDATYKTLTVTSSNPEVIRVINSETGEIEFRKAGTARITATATDGSGQSAYVDLSSNFIYPINRYLTTARLDNLTTGYQSDAVVTHAFDGINYETKSVMIGTNSVFQLKKNAGYVKNTTALGGSIGSITIADPSGTIKVYGSQDNSDYEEISGTNNVYTPDVGKNFSYFKVANESSYAAYFASISISMRGEFATHINTFANAFSSAVGNNCATFSASLWDGLAESFNGLTDDEKDACASVTVSDLANGEGTALDQAMRRYDNIIANYSMNDFIGRSGGSGSGMSTSVFTQKGNSSDSAVTLALIAGTGVLATGGYFFLRKKKES